MLLGDDLPARLSKQVGGPVALIALLKYSRTDELQADLLGFYNLQRAGWDPNGMVDLFKHFGERGVESLMAIIESHPAPADRELQITNELKKFPAKSGLTHHGRLGRHSYRSRSVGDAGDFRVRRRQE